MNGAPLAATRSQGADMIFIGATTEEKGKQLEQFAADLLQHLGYRDIVISRIGPGGDELDVTANKAIPGLLEEVVHAWLCECKARADRLGMGDWEKFLGKLFSEQSRSKSTVYGCLLALSGVNGNVAGAYAELRKHTDHVQLLGEDEIVQKVAEVYALPHIDVAMRRVGQYAHSPSIEFEQVFYERRVWVLVRLGNQRYTIVTPEGNGIGDDDWVRLEPLLAATVGGEAYVPVTSLAIEANQRSEAEGLLLGRLMMADGRLDIGRLLESTDKLDQAVLREALDSVLTEELARLDPNTEEVSLADDTPSQTVSLYRRALELGVPTETITSEYYDAHLQELVTQAVVVQGGIPLTDGDEALVLGLVRLSPSALHYAITPDPMIVTHRQNTPRHDDIDRSDRMHFMKMLYRYLLHDFRYNGSLRRYFYETRQVREVESSERYRFKTVDGAVIESEELAERVGIGQLAEEAGGGYVSVLLLDHAPEPHQWPGIAPAEGNSEPENGEQQ